MSNFFYFVQSFYTPFNIINFYWNCAMCNVFSVLVAYIYPFILTSNKFPIFTFAPHYFKAFPNMTNCSFFLTIIFLTMVGKELTALLS